jgi:hypothetical protein
MRSMLAIAVCLASLASLPACTKGENAGAEEAKREAEKELKEKAAHGEVAKKMSPPVPGSAHVPCTQLIDPAAFTTALGEKEPITVTDATKGDGEAAASCSLNRGGKRPNEAEQKALIKANGKLGVLPGDEICNVTAYCWTIEDPERFQKRCVANGKDITPDSDSIGTFSCRQTVAVGEADVSVFKFYDDDTKCILKVRGGPSMVDNELIKNCAKTARTTIGPAQIAVNASGAPAKAAGSAAGSASGW